MNNTAKAAPVAAQARSSEGSLGAATTPAASAQFAKLQAALGRFDEMQLNAALSEVSDYRLASVLAKRLYPGDAATQQLREAVTTQPAEKKDKRESERVSTLRGARVIYNNKMSVSDCSIRDISKTGCRLAMASTIGIPAHFTLDISNSDRKHECEVVWRSPTVMGVRFLD